MNNYYKLISGDNIVDVISNPAWVNQDIRGRIALCDIAEAMGIVSSDMSTILHIAGAKNFSEGTYDEVAVADITEDEYEELKILLGLNATVPDDGGTPKWEEEPTKEESPEDATLQEVKKRCLEKLSADCRNTIYGGVDVTLSDGSTQHFTLKIEDQLNLITLSTMVTSGETQIPYHASNKLCEYYSAEDIVAIANSATAFKTYHTTYFNSLKNWVLSMNSITEVGSVFYGMKIPAEYCSDILIGILQSMGTWEGVK